MQESPVRPEAKAGTTFPLKILVIGVAVSLLLLAGVGKHMWDSYQDLRAAQGREMRLQQLTGTITYLDEVLTMSARMNAATGDTSWEARYQRYEPQLDGAIQEAKALAPPSYVSSAAVQTDKANVALVEMEHHSFDLVRAGDMSGASALLASPQYEQQKQLYAEGYHDIDDSMAASGRRAINSAEKQWLISIAFMAVPLSIGAWIVISASKTQRNAGNRIVVLTVSVVVLAGALSGVGAFLQVRSASRSYDRALQTELLQKGNGIATTANFFIASLGPSTLTSLVGLANEGFAQNPTADSPNDFRTIFVRLEAWSPSATGYSLLYEKALSDRPLKTAIRGDQAIIASVDTSGNPTSTIDKNDRTMDIYAPISTGPDTRVVMVGTLDASDEFRFFAAQRDKTIRNGILISIAITGFVSLVGGFLSFLVARTLTTRSRIEEALREQTRRDPLTGTLNHSAMVEELRQRISEGPERPPFAVAMVDVDGMKATNDTYGHQVGDAVLKAVAQALSHDGAIVARYGGDEFVAILQSGDRAGAERYRAFVDTQLQEHEVTEPDTGLRVPLSVSMGLAVYPEEARGVMELIKLSDDAMYASRLQRPVVPNLKGMPRRRDERAAHMVSEVIPLLTSDASLADKMRLVAHQLSIGAGYEVVGFELVGPGSPVAATYAFESLNPAALKEWNERSEEPAGRSLHPILERTHRPVIVNDLMTDPRVSDGDRKMAAAGGVHSALAAPMLWHDEFVGVLSVASKRPNAFGPRDAQFVSSVATQVTAIIRMARLLDDLRATTAHLTDAQDETVMLLAAAAEEHEAGLSGHFQGVRSLAEALAGEIGYGEEETRELGLAAALHDVGKIRVQHETLSHIGPLSPQQWIVMRQHTVWGETFFKGHPGFSLAAVIARSHHEHWDGGGYPDGLVGDQIPEMAAITSVADAFDAIVNGRPYRAARAIDEAVQEVVASSGKQFSPRIVDALVRLHARGALPLARSSIQEVAA